MLESVDPRLPTPIYAQIAEGIRVAIARGELGAGDGLPSVRHLASQLRINPATVSQAYRDLESDGLVEVRHGAGTFVSTVAGDRRARERQARLRSTVRTLFADAARLGATPADVRAAVDAEFERTT